ncbi:C40 family peptidase [Microtetraspora malaysiensis]|uniref:C40 family peptidase n=1 Tax=Microtetraspora malaysiensis TaxID=161358 RepID=UPI00083755CE|nr:NlpC/P60 family protein [Microtetraspora malaysiensis]
MRWGRLAALAAVLFLAAGSIPRADELAKVVGYAYASRGIPYSWGGGHGKRPGPSQGTCRGYSGSVRPCPAERTLGLDCSGFTRWMYRLAYGDDVLGRGTTDDHIRRMRRVRTPSPGDLVFYGSRRKTHHVGVYIGGGKMINAFATGTTTRIDDIGEVKDLLGFYHYSG